MSNAKQVHWRDLQTANAHCKNHALVCPPEKDNLCVLCEPSKATLWCYTSIFDDIISISNQRRVGTQWQLSGPVHDN